MLVNDRHPATAVASKAGEVVFLLHGLGATATMMLPMKWRLEAAGYQVRNWSYSSIRQPIQRHGHRLHQEMLQCDQNDRVRRIHVVAHSMGGIVVRCALNLGRPSRLGRVVMLAAPNKGSRLATLCAPWLGWMCEPVEQLREEADSFVNQLAVPEGIDVGVIAASRDLLIRRASTHFPGEQDHIVLPGTHGMLVFLRAPAEQALCFLERGCFERSAKPRRQGPSDSTAQ